MIRQRDQRSAIRLRATLDDYEPSIWRLIWVDDRTTLSDLHRVIQIAMGWLDYHLFDFEVAGIRYEDPGPEAEGEDATAVRLRDLPLEVGDKFRYRYDWGDDWTMTLVIEAAHGVDRHTWLPSISDGERAGPPEDAGGTGQLAELQNALTDPSHPEHDEWWAWLGGDYDPERFDLRSVNGFLGLAVGWGVIGPDIEE